MKKVFVLFVVFVGCLTCIDIAFGILMKPILLSEPDAGNNHSNFKQSLFNKDADVVILGASKANHHYIPDTLASHLNMTVLNTGLDGDNIVTSYVQFKAVAQRHVPHMVIIDLSAGQTAGDFESLLLSHKSYFGLQTDYTEVVHTYCSYEDNIKLHSSFYRLNEALPELAQSYLAGNNQTAGFIPLYGTAPNMAHHHKMTREYRVDEKDKHYNIGVVHKACLDSIVSICRHNNSKVFIVYSPSLISYDDGVTAAYEDFCKNHQIPFINYEGDTAFVNHPELFKDFNHLNIDGARLFTADIINKINH